MRIKFDVTVRHEWSDPALERIEALLSRIEAKVKELLRRPQPVPDTGGMTGAEEKEVFGQFDEVLGGLNKLADPPKAP